MNPGSLGSPQQGEFPWSADTPSPPPGATPSLVPSLPQLVWSPHPRHPWWSLPSFVIIERKREKEKYPLAIHLGMTDSL